MTMPTRKRAKARTSKLSKLAVLTAKAATRSRGAGKPFQAGQSGNPAGRPKGARSRLSEAFLAEFCEVWEAHGKKALLWVAQHDQSTFVRAAAALIPKQVELEEKRAVYLISDHWLTNEEWEAKYCKPN